MACLALLLKLKQMILICSIQGSLFHFSSVQQGWTGTGNCPDISGIEQPLTLHPLFHNIRMGSVHCPCYKWYNGSPHVNWRLVVFKGKNKSRRKHWPLRTSEEMPHMPDYQSNPPGEEPGVEEEGHYPTMIPLKEKKSQFPSIPAVSWNPFFQHVLYPASLSLLGQLNMQALPKKSMIA